MWDYMVGWETRGSLPSSGLPGGGPSVKRLINDNAPTESIWQKSSSGPTAAVANNRRADAQNLLAYCALHDDDPAVLAACMPVTRARLPIEHLGPT